MQVQNISKCVITLRSEDESAILLPLTKPVDVSDKLATGKYAKLLEEAGEVLIIGEPEVEEVVEVKKRTTTRKTSS
jgi:hypothetical protein